MRIVDKEEGWFGREDEKENRGMKLLSGIMIAVAALGFFILANLLDGKALIMGDPYVIYFGNVEVRPGRTRVRNLAVAGYDLSDLSIGSGDGDESSCVYSEVYDLNAKADKRTVYTSITLVKDGRCVAVVSVVNEKNTEIPLAECKIGGVAVRPDYYESGSVSLEGISFDQLSAQTLTKALGKPRKVSEDGETYTWERGVHRITLKCEKDGSLEILKTEYSKF